MRLLIVAGARPNFVRVAPLMEALETKVGVDARLVLTGQHCQEVMSGASFADLALPASDRGKWTVPRTGDHIAGGGPKAAPSTGRAG